MLRGHSNVRMVAEQPTNFITRFTYKYFSDWLISQQQREPSQDHIDHGADFPVLVEELQPLYIQSQQYL